MFEETEVTVVEGTDDFVRLTLFREGNADLPLAINFTTISGTAQGGKR